ncbi:MAG: excinuclease ABC subunit C [Waddliaceae bacterium]|nr:excinuclease ABC subunit C [Waddliaceae bacterium]
MVFERSLLSSFPQKPGVYLMKNSRSKVIYVGKAKKLRNRLRQYFQEGGDGRAMIPFLLKELQSIETIVVSSEKEALLLENTLIKQHQPKYNAVLKDDKSYVSLKISKHPFPLIQMLRYKGKAKADGQYFGPYTSAYAARQTLELLKRLFPLRTCSDREFASRKRPCILYGMKRCVAPCVGFVTEKEYAAHVQRVVKFLRGQDKELIEELRKEMEKAAEKLEFEQAQSILETIRHLENTLEKQEVYQTNLVDCDVLAVYRQAADMIITQMLYRGGKLTGSKHHSFSGVLEDDAELLQSFLLQQYESMTNPPYEVILPTELEHQELVEEILSLDKAHKVRLHVPKKGQKRRFLEMAEENAEAHFMQTKDAEAMKQKNLLDMQERFQLTRFPYRIECFDNSHISGSEAVSCMVVFSDGEKDRSRYRKYKLREAGKADDYAAMREVLLRRYKRAKDEDDLPDLILLDGGKGQLNIALDVLESLNISSVDIIAVAKEKGRHDKGGTREQVFLPGRKDPILLPKNSPVLFFLQVIRDEAHRFAVEFHRKRRSKSMVKSSLEDIPGIGPNKRQNLLKHFGSIKQIKAATEEELKEVKGITQDNIKRLLEWGESN